MLAAAMNGVDARASDGAPRAVPRRGIAVLGAVGGFCAVGAAVLAAGGRLGLGAVAAGVAGAAVYTATTGGRLRGWPTRWTAFTVPVLGRVPDASVMSAIAWHFRLNDRRVAALAVSVVALTFLAAYARTRAIALGWPSETSSFDSLRYAAAFAALAVPGGAEIACWLLALMTFVEFLRVGAEAWRHSASA
jgi:hypothetical protein